MHTHTQRKTQFFAAAVFSVLSLLLFALIPGVKASAAAKSYTSPCTGTTINYYNSSVTTLSSNANVTITCTNRGSYTIKVKPNTLTSSRSIRLNANGGGKTIDTLTITQYGVPTKTFSAGCLGGNYSFTPSGAYYYNYSNTAVCNSRSGSSFVVKPTSSTSARSCTVTVKNSAGTIIYYVYINQNGVPTSSLSIGCAGGNLAFSPAGASSYVYSNTAVCSSRSGNNFVVKPNSSTSARSCTVSVKNSAGNIFYYVYINQGGVPVKTVSVAGKATSFSYGKSGASTLNPKDKSMITKVTASNPGSFTVSVSANPYTTISRTSDIIVKNSAGAYIEIIRVTQEKYTAVTRTYNYNSDPRTVNYTVANIDPSKTAVSNSAMASCTSQGGGKFQVKLTQNTSTASRSCTITFKDSYGTALEKYVVNQSGVPLKTVSVAGSTTSFAYGKSGVTTFSIGNNKMVTKVSASNAGSFTVFVSANPSQTATRTCDVIAKTSGGVYAEIIRVTQAKYTAVTRTYNYNSDPRTVNYTVANTDPSKTAVSNSAMASCTSQGGGKFQVKLTQNTSTASRSCTITFKDSYGTALEKYVVNQSGVPLKTVSVAGSTTSFAYGKSGVTTFSIGNNKMVTKVSASNAGSFTIFVSANPSQTATRTCDVIAKTSGGVYAEIIRITQAKFEPPTNIYSFDSKRQTITYVNSDAARFTYSNQYMCKTAKALSSGRYQFVINANSGDPRKELITVYDKFDTVIAKLSVSQSAIVEYLVGSGEGENITYTNKDAVRFNLPINIKSVRKISDGKFIFTQTVNRGTLTLDEFVEVLDASGNIIQYLMVTSQPNVMRIKSSVDKEIPNAGKVFDVTFETSNPTTITLENAVFDDTGAKIKKINKNAVKANTYNSTSFKVRVEKLDSTSNQTVTIKITNGLETETKKLTQLGRQIGFRAATAEYPLGSLGRDRYVYKIVAATQSGWTQIGETVKLTDAGFNLFAALSFEMEECAGLLDFSVVNGGKFFYNGADFTHVYAEFYKDAADNRYVLLTGNDSDTKRQFQNDQAQNIYHSDISINYNKNGVKYTGYIDVDHAILANWVFWVDSNGKLQMNLRKFGKDSFKINGAEVVYNMGYQTPGDGYHAYYPVSSKAYAVSGKYQALLNKLGK